MILNTICLIAGVAVTLAVVHRDVVVPAIKKGIEDIKAWRASR